MTDTTTRTETPERFITAPAESDGTPMAWLNGYDQYTGSWVAAHPDVHEHALYPEPSPDGEAFSPGVRVPADETASKADLMALAATAANLERRWMMLTTRLAGVAAILDMGNRADG